MISWPDTNRTIYLFKPICLKVGKRGTGICLKKIILVIDNGYSKFGLWTIEVPWDERNLNRDFFYCIPKPNAMKILKTIKKGQIKNICVELANM